MTTQATEGLTLCFDNQFLVIYSAWSNMGSGTSRVNTPRRLSLSNSPILGPEEGHSPVMGQDGVKSNLDRPTDLPGPVDTLVTTYSGSAICTTTAAQNSDNCQNQLNHQLNSKQTAIWQQINQQQQDWDLLKLDPLVDKLPLISTSSFADDWCSIILHYYSVLKNTMYFDPEQFEKKPKHTQWIQETSFFFSSQSIHTM